MTDRNDLSLVERSAVRNVVSREWRQYLKADERDLVSYILEATLAWGHDTLQMTFEQMKAGIAAPESSEYTWFIPPIEISRAQFYRLLASVCAKGVLLAESVQRKCTRIKVNLDWSPKEGVMSPTLAVSKQRAKDLAKGESKKDEFEQEPDGLSQFETTKAWGGPQAETDPEIEGFSSSQSETTVVSIGDPLKKNLKKEKEEPEAEALRAPQRVTLPLPKAREARSGEKELPRREETVSCIAPAARPTGAVSAIQAVRDVVSRSTEKSHAARVERGEEARHLDDARSYHETYLNAWLEAYPGVPCPTWTDREMYVLRAVMRRRLMDNIPARHDFIEFVVKNWSYITTAHFGWMKTSQPPNMPSLRFLCADKLSGHFFDAFAEKGRNDYIKLLPAEQRELEQYMAGGMKRDEALVEIGKRRALSQIHSQEREVRKINGEALRAAEAARRERELATRADMARRAAERKEAPAKVHEPFEELRHLPPIELVELPPFDPSKWN